MMPIGPRVPMTPPTVQPPMQGGASPRPGMMPPGGGAQPPMNPMALMGLLQKIRGGAPAAPAAPAAGGMAAPGMAG